MAAINFAGYKTDQNKQVWRTLDRLSEDEGSPPTKTVKNIQGVKDS